MDIEAIWVSVELAAFTTLILFLIGLPFAYWLAVTRWRLKFLLESLVILPMILPPTVLGFYILVAIGPISPFDSALDLPTREQLRHELRHSLTKLAVPGIVVTHDRVETLALGDHVIVMDHGCVRQSGPPQDVFSAPVDLAVARIVGVDNIESGKVIRMTNGLATIQVGSSELLALSAARVSGQVCVCIRAEDVMLEKGAVARQSSARNHLFGRIRSLDREGPMVRVGIDCGFPLKALVTYQAFEDMGLCDGMEVTALVKAPAIRLIPRE